MVEKYDDCIVVLELGPFWRLVSLDVVAVGSMNMIVLWLGESLS